MVLSEPKEASNGLAIVAAHTDSPNLRLKPVLKGASSWLISIWCEVTVAHYLIVGLIGT